MSREIPERIPAYPCEGMYGGLTGDALAEAQAEWELQYGWLLPETSPPEM